MSNNKGKFILPLDGGGIRGIFEMQFLKRFCEVAGIRSVKDAFGTIVGTSIGGICAVGLAKGLSPDELLQILIKKGPKLFSYYPDVQVIKKPVPGPVDAITMGNAVFGPANPFVYNNKYPCNDGYENDAPLLKVLQEVLGKDTRMNELGTNVAATSVKYKSGIAGSGGWNINCDNIYFPFPLKNMNIVSPILLSNVISPITEGNDALCTDVGLATSAASYYFPPIQMTGASNPQEDFWYLDGGFVANNPALYAYALAQYAYPFVEQYSMLSIGTGITNVGNDITPMPGLMNLQGYSDKLEMLPQLLDVTINSPSSAVSSCMELIALCNPAQLSYYRFQKQLPKELWPLDNVSNNFPDGLIQAANEQFDKESVKINLFIQNSGF